jgi:hypothetical protein
MFDWQIQTTDLCAGCSSADYTDQVEVVPANGGRPQMIWSGGTGSWSPDGKQIAITSLQGGAMNGLWIVGAQGGSRRQIAGPTWLQGGLSISWQPLG